MSEENIRVIFFFAGALIMLFAGILLVPSQDEILARHGCEIVPIETKLRRLEIGIQGLDARLHELNVRIERISEEMQK